ncbi:HAD family hydrolase [Myceligenerans crystallogenes]|uniref:Phosphoglycolate phosphatase n=1 Tax=Myceligenerans crystallogenes TaxID=316335 RepID=A0ABN2ND17_9MICO
MSDARKLLATADVVLLDFDGPVTPLMPPPANIATADAGRAVLRRHDVEMPDEIQTTSDHLAVIRWVADLGADVLSEVEDACIHAEVKAARTAVPTDGAHELLAELHRQNVPVVIVSNNAAEAIDVYLTRHRLTNYVTAVVGRPARRPDLMKPNPFEVTEALRQVSGGSARAVLIGDSVSDVEVARATAVRSIGYAKTEKRGEELEEAGADAITTTIAALLEAF